MDGPFLVNAVMFITGIFGNLSVCCVILRIPSMRSATNYYLFSLAVADLLILLLGKRKLRLAFFIYPYILLMKITTLIFIEKNLRRALQQTIICSHWLWQIS